MGQATVDLPDPLEDPKGAAAPAPANTDDLLAELASNQIDQMLAEAELDRSFDGADDASEAAAAAVEAASRQMIAPPDVVRESSEAADLSPEDVAAAINSSAPAPAPEQTIEDLDEAAAHQLDQLFDELQDADVVASDAPPAKYPGKPAQSEPPAPPVSEPARAAPAPHVDPVVASGPVDPKVDEQLNALFAEIEAPPAPDPETAKAVSAALDPTEQTGRLEQQVLAEDAVLRATAMLNEPAPAPEVPSPDDLCEPLYVRMLAWINAPLDWCSESARQALGKAAIFTLINALAVLAYVLFFRK